MNDMVPVRYESVDENSERSVEWRAPNGNLHREDGPAVVKYFRNGNLKFKAWSQNDLRHRLDGPAFFCYSRTGNVYSETWWIKGEEIESPYDKYPLTKEQIIEMKLKYG